MQFLQWLFRLQRLVLSAARYCHYYAKHDTEFALKLPVITIPIMSYWDGQGLRLVLSFSFSDLNL